MKNLKYKNILRFFFLFIEINRQNIGTKTYLSYL